MRHLTRSRKTFVRFSLNLLAIIWLATLFGPVVQAQNASGCPAKFPGDQQGGFSVSAMRGCAPFKVTVTKSDAAVQSDKYWFNFRNGDYKQYDPDKVANVKTDTTYQKPGKYVILQFGSKGGTASFACQTIEVLATPKPKFRMISCNTRQVTVTIPSDSANIYDFYDINWGDGSVPTTGLTVGASQTRTYANTNPRTVQITGRYNGVSTCAIASDPAQITPIGNVTTTPAITRLELTGPTSAQLNFTGQPGKTFDIYQKTTTGTYAKVLTNVGGAGAAFSQTIQGLSNQSAQYCFKVANLADACTAKPLESDDLCSLPLAVTAQNKQNQVQWTAHPLAVPPLPFGGYSITKNGLPFSTFPSLSSFQTTDMQVECGKQYTYQVTARIGNMVTVSEAKAVTAVNTVKPPALKNVYATVESGKILLIWERPAGGYKSFSITRAGGNTPNFEPIGDTLTNRFLDGVNPDAGPFCYKVGYQDLCGNEADASEPICPVFVKQQGAGIAWSPYQTFPTGLKGYTVEQLDERGNVTKSFNVGTQTSFEPDLTNVGTQQLYYRVRAQATNGFNSYSNNVTLSLTVRLYVPEAFSPNGDGINDTFTAKGLFIQTFSLTVFNRWGEALYRSENIEQGWDGSFNGQQVPEGTYLYLISVQDTRGEPFVKRGGLLLLR